MVADDAEAVVADVMTVVLQMPVAPGRNLLRRDTPGWDSLRHMEIVFALEDVLGVRFDETEVAGLDSVAAITARVEAKRAA